MNPIAETLTTVPAWPGDPGAGRTGCDTSLALCRLCHWTFDEGLMSLSEVHVILASPQLTGSDNVPAHLGALVGRLLVGPADAAWRPDLEALRRHREKVFRRR